jgi:DivIVA domain-containing protein
MTDSVPGFANPDRVTGADLLTVTFPTSKAFGRGYEHHEVDAFVASSAALVDHLQARVSAAESQIAALQDRIERDSRSSEVAHAVSVLTKAQQTADKTVAQADDYSTRVMSEARELYEDTRRNAATLEQETAAKARHVYDDAVGRAEALEREAQERIAQLTMSAQVAAAELDRDTVYLRTLRDATRTQMMTFLEGLMDHLADEYGRANPLAAEAANDRPGRSAQRAAAPGRRGGKTAARASRSRVAGLRGGPSGENGSAAPLRPPVDGAPAQLPLQDTGSNNRLDDANFRP